MRKLLFAILFILVPLTVFVAGRRIGLTGAAGSLFMFVTCGALLVWAAKEDFRAGKLRLQKDAAMIGFQPAESGEVDLTIYPLNGEGWVEGAASGEMRGLKAWIFEYEISDEVGDSRRYLRQTVVAFDVEGANLPIFQIRPLSWSTSIFDNSNKWKDFNGHWESDDSICFPDANGFHKRFELVSSAEEGVRRHFNAKLLDTIAALNVSGCVVQGYYTSVLVFTPKKIVPREEMEAFVHQGADIASAILAAEKRVMAAVAK